MAHISYKAYMDTLLSTDVIPYIAAKDNSFWGKDIFVKNIWINNKPLDDVFFNKQESFICHSFIEKSEARSSQTVLDNSSAASALPGRRCCYLKTIQFSTSTWSCPAISSTDIPFFIAIFTIS